LDVDIDGKAVWIVDRCGGESCAGSRLNPILKFDESGRLVKRFGAGIFVIPHGIHVDREGYVWVTDAGGPDVAGPDRDGKGHAVYKFNPNGEIVLTLGKPGAAGDGRGDLLCAPSDVVTAPSGDVFVADGHPGPACGGQVGAVARVAKFTQDGRFVKSWGSPGSGPGELRSPHGLALDSQGRLFVADCGNKRIEIFNEEGRFLEQWGPFGSVRGIFIDRHDVLYVAGADSSDAGDSAWKAGVWIGSARDGRVFHLISDPADAVAADARGNVFTAQLNGGALGPKMYVRQ